ncbi:asparaginase [Psychrobacter frigidicola]|uniref:Asparaginase n=1 Tax=Psychrobacter frigidicola TaxID=45611 RepID=A0A5C7A729_9GAMM|nr:asparaginase [Psychrobacter frigidicola]TXD97606.1 asparaginase [Psychrobacter frigidicola]
MRSRTALLLHSDSNPIQVIYAGGTFGSYGKPLAPLSTAEFLPVMQVLLAEHESAANLPAISWLDNPLIKDSSQLNACDFVHFYTLLLESYAAGHRQFVLITGTDTLSYLGAFLAEAFAGTDLCLIVTGSMSPLLDSEMLESYSINANSDAWDNLSDALRLAAAGESGVKISFGGESWAAQTVQKIHSHDFMAFTGHTRAAYPANSYLKALPATRKQHWLDDQHAVLEAIQTRAEHSRVHALYCLPNDPEVLCTQIQALISQPPCGIILLGFGAGNIPYSSALAAALQSAYDCGHMIVCASQCPFGGVSDNYAAGSWQYEYQVIAGGRLTIPAIYARLLWLLLRYATAARRRQRWMHTISKTQTTISKHR